jgi:hypothetical protein
MVGINGESGSTGGGLVMAKRPRDGSTTGPARTRWMLLIVVVGLLTLVAVIVVLSVAAIQLAGWLLHDAWHSHPG